MTIKTLKNNFLSGNDAYFNVNDISSGVSSEVSDSVFHFTMWYGDVVKETSNIDEVLFSSFFDDKSILELMKNVQINFT